MTFLLLTEHPFYTKIEFAGDIHTVAKAYYSKVNTAKKKKKNFSGGTQNMDISKSFEISISKILIITLVLVIYLVEST